MHKHQTKQNVVHILKANLLFVAFVACLLFSLPQGCAKTCTKDQDCNNHFRCGSGEYCLARCFVGEKNACQMGYVCDQTNTTCLKDTTALADANSPENKPEAKKE